jgi:hypothetical protein
VQHSGFHGDEGDEEDGKVRKTQEKRQKRELERHPCGSDGVEPHEARRCTLRHLIVKAQTPLKAAHRDSEA